MSTTMPNVPQIPVLTEERMQDAALRYMDQLLTIAEAAASKGISEQSFRDHIKKNPFFAEITVIVGFKKDRTPIVKIPRRLLWLAEDRAAQAAAKVHLVRRTARRARTKH